MKNGLLSSNSQIPNIQVVSFPKGNLVIDLRSGQPPHPYRLLYFLTLFRNDTVEDYLSAITLDEYGKASFLQGGLAGIDVVIVEHSQGQNKKLWAEDHLDKAKKAQDWGAANWWKGYICGLEIAEEVRRSSWFDPKRHSHKLINQINVKRGKIE